MRADGWNRIPLVRMTTVSLEPGTWDFDDLIADTDDGLYVETNNSWSIDDKRLNFQFACEIGWEIKGGELGPDGPHAQLHRHHAAVLGVVRRGVLEGPLAGVGAAQLRQGRADPGRARCARGLACAVPRRLGGGGTLDADSRAGFQSSRAAPSHSPTADEAEALVSAEHARAYSLREQPHQPERRRRRHRGERARGAWDTRWRREHQPHRRRFGRRRAATPPSRLHASRPTIPTSPGCLNQPLSRLRDRAAAKCGRLRRGRPRPCRRGDRRAVALPRPDRGRQGADELARHRDREQPRRRRGNGDRRRASHRAVDERRRQRMGELPGRGPGRLSTRRGWAARRPTSPSARPTRWTWSLATYRVVLGPEAVADVMDFLAYVGFSAKAFAEGRSFMSGNLGKQVMSEYVTIVDDALAPARTRAHLRLRGRAEAARLRSLRAESRSAR